MKRNNKKIYYALIILIICTFFSWLKMIDHQMLDDKEFKTTEHTQQTNLKSELALANQKSDCEILKKPYLNLEQLKKQNELDLRFENTHKKFGNKIYRLRHFYKDGDEGEIETFLVYLEDKAEMAKIIEKNAYTRGDLYTKIENSKGEILYHEEGFNLTRNEKGSVFLHYINHRLMGMQGVLQNQNEQHNIDCHFQQE